MGIKYSKRLEDIFLCLQCPAVNQTNVKSASRTPFNYSKSNHWLTEDMIMYNKACSLSWLGFERDVINYPETTGFNGKKNKRKYRRRGTRWTQSNRLPIDRLRTGTSLHLIPDQCAKNTLHPINSCFVNSFTPGHETSSLACHGGVNQSGVFS